MQQFGSYFLYIRALVPDKVIQLITFLMRKPTWNIAKAMKRIAKTPSHVSIPPIQDGTTAKDDC